MGRKSLAKVRKAEILDHFYSVLKKEGFAGAIKQRLDSVESRSGIKGEFVMTGEGELTELEEDTFYRIIQEALNNILKHSSATSVKVTVSVNDISELLIKDDGVGFEPDNVSDKGGIGLISIQERAEHLGGSFTYESAPDKGTLLRITIPRNCQSG